VIRALPRDRGGGVCDGGHWTLDRVAHFCYNNRASKGWAHYEVFSQEKDEQMSLVVSLRVPDGVVIATDSLSTSQTRVEIVAGGMEVECPHCKHKVSAGDLTLPPLAFPFSASSFTQKLFSIHGRFALGFFGQGIINERSIHYHLQQFERSSDSNGALEATRDALITYLEEQLLIQYPTYREEAPVDQYPAAFHLNGYEEVDEKQVGVTYEVYVGRENVVRRRDTIGCTIGGEQKVVQKLWDIGREDPRFQFRYPLFSLQDAIDLSEFLINATSTFQRFANEVPTVGGAVDIALVTPFRGFQWIRRKALMEVLEDSA
jgi:hypothetical protein